MTPSINAASSTVLHIGPTWSKLHAMGITPRLLTRPYVGLNPTTPQYDEGMRIDPPVSVPRVPMQRSAAMAAAEPPDDPPGTWSSAHGLCTAPKYVTAEVPPRANSCRFSLPTRIAPAFFKRTTTSASSVGMRSLKTPLAAVVRMPA